METLKRKNSKYILLQVSDIPKTSLVLERQFGVTDYSVQDDHSLRIYNTSLDMAAVNKALVVQDVAVISSQLCKRVAESSPFIKLYCIYACLSNISKIKDCKKWHEKSCQQH